MRRILTIAALILLLSAATIHAQTTAPATTAATFSSTPAERLQSLLGLFAFMLLAFLIGRARGARTIPWRVIGWGIVLQFAFGAVVLFSPDVLEGIQYGIQRLLDFTLAGVRMIFGSLADRTVPVTAPDGAPLGVARIGTIFAVVVLPTIIFVSTLTAILYHTGVMTAVVHALAWVMQKTMGTSGAETLSTAANIFVGQTEAPLLVKPFLAVATRSELMAILVGGFANIASGVIVVYTEFLKDYIPNVGGHLAAACFISAPATLVVAKLMSPETETPVTAGGARFEVEQRDLRLAVRSVRPARRHARTGARVRDGAAGVAGGRAVARVPRSRRAARRQDGAERVSRLSANEPIVRPRPQLPLPARRADRNLRPVRLRQLRLGRHPDRRHQHDGADAET
jgi:hypothetical protein